MKGRRSTRTKEQRIEQLKHDMNRSGFTGEEIVQIIVDWHGIREAVVYRGVDRQVFTNSLKTGDSK